MKNIVRCIYAMSVFVLFTAAAWGQTLDHFAISYIDSTGTLTAGTPFNITITAQDASNATVNDFTGTVNITSTGTLSAGGGTTAAFIAGVLVDHSVTISNTGSFTVTATNSAGSEAGTSNAFNVNPGALDHFVIASISGPKIIGTTFDINITAQDANNNTVTGFEGTADISLNSGTISPIVSSAFSAGLKTESVTISTVGTGIVITVTLTSGIITGSSNSFDVIPSAPVVASPIIVGATSVSGTSSEADGTTIEIYVNSSSVGTTTVSSNAWILSSMTPLTLGQVVHATATISGFVSSISNQVTVNTDFRSVTSGNWSSTSTWEQWDGASWVAATSTPTSLDNTISILNSHIVSVDANISVDQLTINSGATLVDSIGRTLTIANGADSVDMVVNGTFINHGTITTTGRISFENGAMFYNRIVSGAVPASTWRNGSTCQIDSMTTSGINSQSLYNLIWNATNQTANNGPNFPNNYVLRGSLTITSSKGFQWRVANISGGETRNVYIRGDVNVNGATAYLTGTGSGADTLTKVIVNVDGNVNVTAGQWSLNNSSNAYAEWKVKGNINITGGTMQSGASGWNGRRTLNFAGGTTQTFNVVSPGTIGTAGTTFKVSNNSVVQVEFPWTLMAVGALNLENGKFVTTATNIISVPAAAVIYGGNASSYINGPMIHTIASTSLTTKTFPIGKGSSYRPVVVNVNQDAATATTYTAEVFNSAPVSDTLPASLLSVSPSRYYSVVKGAGANISPTLGATIQLSYDIDDSVHNALLARVAMDTAGSKWLNLGGSGTADTTGTITSNAFYTLDSNIFVTAKADTTTPVYLASLTTTAMSEISTTFATSGGNISNDGGAAVSARGVCWNITGTPTNADSLTSDGTGGGVFTSSITGLTPGVTYHLRAYATNKAGTSYGDEVTFTTLSAIVSPTVTTTDISNILVTSAKSGGTVTEWGGDSVTARGICWNTTGTPSISDTHSSDGSDLGSYISGIAPLIGNTTYYVRAYAINSSGAGYGNELSFTTQTPAADTMVIVAQDGSGDYTTVQAAFTAVPASYTGKWKIFVKKGIYHEKDTLVAGKINVILEGEDRDSTVIWTDCYAERDGGTSGSFTISLNADDFIAKNITFENTYWPNRYGAVTNTQGVAVSANGDRQQFINCVFNGYQDTYYTRGSSGTGRAYHKNCTFKGTVDYIFGRNICVFDSCTFITARAGGVVTAGGTDATSLYGYIFRNCTLLGDEVGSTDSTGWVRTAYTAANGYYLGRPWQGGPRVVYMHCYESSNLHAAGWTTMSGTNPTLYTEFNCYGPGAASRPVIFAATGQPSTITTEQAGNYSLTNIFAKSSAMSNLILYDWMPSEAAAADDMPFEIPISVENFNSKVLVPKELKLDNNFPNPFNPSTTLRFSVPKDGRATLKVYNLIGQEVATLFDGVARSGQYISKEFSGNRLASGVYFARLQYNGNSLVQRMLLVK